MAEKFKFDTPNGQVTTDSPAAAVRMRYANGYTESARATKVDAAVDDAKSEKKS